MHVVVDRSFLIVGWAILSVAIASYLYDSRYERSEKLVAVPAAAAMGGLLALFLLVMAVLVLSLFGVFLDPQ